MVSAIVLLLLKIVLIGAALVFGGCVLTIMCCCVALLFQLGKGADSLGPFALFAHYRSVKHAPALPSGIAQAEFWMHRARRIGIWAWFVALAAGLAMVIIALASGQR